MTLPFKKEIKLTGLIFIALGLFVFFFVVLKLLSFENFKALYARLTSRPGGSKYEVKHLAWAASLPGRIIKNTCLPQALTLKYLMRNDRDAQLVIGINNRPQEKFSAHAWIEKRGEIIMGGSTPHRFTPIWIWR